MCLNEMYSEVHIGKHLSDTLPIQNGLTRRCFIATAFQLCFRLCHEIKYDTSGAGL
jgi:hypothetical protein